MDIQIIAVGKIKEPYLRQGIQEYTKRLTPYCKLSIIELHDEKAPERLSSEQQNNIKHKEAERIVRAQRPGAFTIALAIQGKSYTSESFAQTVDKLGINGTSSIDFIIGGSLGLDESILSSADLLLSFSSFTFPHQLMRLILLEQIYRAYKIMHGEPYHK